MKNLKLICLMALLISALSAVDVLAQKPEDLMGQMLKNSHPGPNHLLLGHLMGIWNFQDSKLTFVKGKLVRKAIYDGRFYTVEITGGKLQLPVADGKMKEDNYQGLQIEGYDNLKLKFITTSLNNHIGSDIQYQEGVYDPDKKEFRYDWDSELVKGEIKHNRRVVALIDGTHYKEIYYELQNGQYVKIRELIYTKSES